MLYAGTDEGQVMGLAFLASVMSQFEAPPASNADIIPTEFHNLHIDVSGVPISVTWNDQDSAADAKRVEHSAREHLTLQLYHDTFRNVAFFQVKANIAFKSRRERTHIFLAIRPEQIGTVVCVGCEDGVVSTSGSQSTASYCLQFSLKKPPALIVPHGDLTPKHKSSRLVLESLQALAEQTCISIRMPTAKVPKPRLLLLCEAVSSGGVHSPSKFNDLASLYGGKGGRVYEHTPRLIVTEHHPSPEPTSSIDESPPSYDRLNPSHPLQSQGPDRGEKAGLKRRRWSSGPDNSMLTKSYDGLPNSIEDFCKQVMDRIESGFCELGSRLDTMDQRLTTLESSVERHADKVRKTIHKASKSSSEEIADIRAELDRGLYDAKKETEEIIDVRLEDELQVTRAELEDYIKDEVATIEGRLENRLESSLENAQVSLDFSWNK
ncbi:hypothetical protein BD289DRAFT_69566 [Coniella lustricola]|uniref:Uncharacterized protein n=1 Tax=Coniella lustricola TaxID=2025994 RepID=A0A2T2ZZX5_9PEZI|nr:hypothetical protein BD289DRAFT_69566 [Coniella lustricola]